MRKRRQVPSQTRPLPTVVEDPVQALIRTLQEQLHAPVLVYWTPTENNIAMEDGQVLRRILDGQPKAEVLYLCLTSSGGNGLASLPIVRQLRQHCRRLVVLVPVQAASAATMIALGADEVQMGTCAYLTPVDTSLSHPLAPTYDDGKSVTVSQEEVTRVLALWDKHNGHGSAHPLQHLFPFIHPLVIGAIERSTSMSNRICDTMLTYHMHQKTQRQKVVSALVGGYPSHAFPILVEEAAAIGIPAKPMRPEIESLLVRLVESHVEKKITVYDVNGLMYERRTKTIIERLGLRATYSERITEIPVENDDDEEDKEPRWRRSGIGWQLHRDGSDEGIDIAIED